MSGERGRTSFNPSAWESAAEPTGNEIRLGGCRISGFRSTRLKLSFALTACSSRYTVDLKTNKTGQ
jgi:hypothetical protein